MVCWLGVLCSQAGPPVTLKAQEGDGYGGIFPATWGKENEWLLQDPDLNPM